MLENAYSSLKGGRELFKKKFSKVWLLLLVIACGAFMYFSNASIQYAEETSDSIQQLSNSELLTFIEQYDPLINKISNELHEKKYGFLLDYGVLPSGKIEIIVNLPNIVKEGAKKKIENIILEVVKENSLNPDTFEINIRNHYEQSKIQSVGLSYNNLMGHILENMSEKKYGSFSVTHNISSDSINIEINLTEDKNDSTQKEVKELVEKTIIENNFNPKNFNVEITSNIDIK